jgi:hypothetical protein
MQGRASKNQGRTEEEQGLPCAMKKIHVSCAAGGCDFPYFEQVDVWT